MAQNITETESWDTPLTIFSDGDALNGANFLTHLQKIANRLKYIGARLGITGSPAPLVKQYTDIAALKAVNPGTAGYATGDVVWILGTQHLGAYRYDSASSTTEDRPWVIAPTTGSGRWFHMNYDLRPRNAALTDTSNRDVSSGTWADLPSLSMTLAGGITGDILEVEVWARYGEVVSGNAEVRVVVVDGASTVLTPTGGASKQVGTAGEIFVGIVRTVLAASGTVTIKMQGQTTGTTCRVNACSMRARLVKDEA
jgi:hypothetical protein